MKPRSPASSVNRKKDVKFVLPDKRALLRTPENLTIPRLFVAATRQNDGKTTTCLGLFAALQTRFRRVAYIKPVGQRFIEVEGLMIDEDSLLLDSIYNVDAPIEAMSPIAIDATFTRRYLTDPEQQQDLLVDKICRAFDRTTYEKDAVIIEGSGHAGVGAVFDLSNAQVARALKAKAILVATGGIGRPVDEITLNKSLFDKHGVEVIGAILNKVLPEKVDLVRDFAARGLDRLGVPLLGVIPVARQLSAPNLSQIVEEVEGRWMNGKEEGAHERILRIVVGAMTARGIIDYFQPGVLIIAPGDRDDIILAAIAASGISGFKALSGIILTRNIMPHPRLMEMLAHTDIPVAICKEDSYSVASRITSMTIKTQPQDSDKIPLIKQLVLEHVNIDLLLQKLQ